MGKLSYLIFSANAFFNFVDLIFSLTTFSTVLPSTISENGLEVYSSMKTFVMEILVNKDIKAFWMFSFILSDEYLWSAS